MGTTCKSMLFSTLLLLLASTGASANHDHRNVVRPLHGFSFNYGYPALHQYRHHYLPKPRYGSRRNRGFRGLYPHGHSFRGRYNDHRPYYYRHPYSPYYRGGSSLYFRF